MLKEFHIAYNFQTGIAQSSEISRRDLLPSDQVSKSIISFTLFFSFVDKVGYKLCLPNCASHNVIFFAIKLFFITSIALQITLNPPSRPAG